MAKLTPALLAGKEYKELVKLKMDDETFEVEIRPLTHLEKTEVQAIETASIKMNTKTMGKTGSMANQSMEMNAGEVLRDSAKAKLKMIAISTVDTDWTEENIDKLWKSEWIDAVAKRISEISGIEVDGVNSFRKE